MGAVTLSLPSYPELGLVTLNLLSELLTKCGLGQHPPVINFGSLLLDKTKLDRLAFTMLAIRIFLQSYRHIILAAFVAPSHFGLPFNVLREI